MTYRVRVIERTTRTRLYQLVLNHPVQNWEELFDAKRFLRLRRDLFAASSVQDIALSTPGSIFVTRTASAAAEEPHTAAAAFEELDRVVCKLIAEHSS